MLQVTQGIADHQERCRIAVSPPHFFECAHIERYRSKAFHSRVARMSCHCVVPALEDRYLKIAVVPNSVPIAICASHCIKSFHAAPLAIIGRACPSTIALTFRAERE